MIDLFLLCLNLLLLDFVILWLLYSDMLLVHDDVVLLILKLHHILVLIEFLVDLKTIGFMVSCSLAGIQHPMTNFLALINLVSSTARLHKV